MTRFRRSLGPLFLAAAVVAIGEASSTAQGTRSAGEKPNPCDAGSLPSDVQNRLKTDFGSWKIQEPGTLSEHTRRTWTDRKLVGCPGIAIGRFRSPTAVSYAVILVPIHPIRPDAGYRFLVFSRNPENASYETIVVEQSDDHGASNYFIRKVSIREFFSEASKKRFHVEGSDAILMVDSAENEYEADIYFWSDGRFQQQPVDE